MFLGSSLRQIIFQRRTKGCGLVVAGPICGAVRGLGGRGKKGEQGFETVLVRAFQTKRPISPKQGPEAAAHERS